MSADPVHGSSSPALTSPRPRAVAGPGLVEAVVFATAAFEDGPTALLPWEDGTVLERLLGQLRSLGAATVHVITRPGLLGDVPGAQVHVCADLAEELRTAGAIARNGTGVLVVAQGDVVAHREALAGLLADPRLATAILGGRGRLMRPFPPRARTARGRVVSAASAYHAVRKPNSRFLGVMKVAPAEREALAGAAERLAELVAPPLPDGWEATLRSKRGAWARWLARHAGDLEPAPVLSAEDAALLERNVAAVADDACSLLLVGLIRADAMVRASNVRRLFWARPLTRAAAEQAALDIRGYDEDKVLLDSAVKPSDGFFTTFFVSPYSKYIARFAARRGWTPNAITVASLLIGIVAAAAFAAGSRAGLIAGAILLQIAFTTDCVDGQLARYTRTFSKLGAWLDSVFDRTKEYIVFAGLAIGGHGIWLLAGAALSLQTFRHTLEFSYAATRHRAISAVPQPPLEQPSDVIGRRGAAAVEAEDDDDAPEEPVAPRRPRRRSARTALRVWRALERVPGLVWVKKMIAFPIGERFAAISVTAAISTPHMCFVVVLVWGGVAAVYTLTGRVLRSVA